MTHPFGYFSHGIHDISTDSPTLVIISFINHRSYIEAFVSVYWSTLQSIHVDNQKLLHF